MQPQEQEPEQDPPIEGSMLEADAPEMELVQTPVSIKKKSPKKKSGKKGRRSSLRSKSMLMLSTPVAAEQPSPRALMSRSLTQAVSPQLKVDKRMKESKAILSSEDLVLARVAEERTAERLKIDKAQAMYRKLKAKGFQSKVASSSTNTIKKLTIPRAPKSALMTRLGAKVPSTTKRSPPKKPERALCTSPKAPTIPMPFTFATDTRLKSTSSSNSLRATLTAGELAQKFFQDPRSHNVPEQHKKLTEPHSPSLRTKQRCMSASKERPLSYDERLEQEMQEMLKRSFKARELDRRIFESNGELGVPKVEAKPLTVPQEFNLALEKRAAELKEKQAPAPEEEEHHFKALPMPDFVREAPNTPTAKATFRPTIPVSPKMHGGDRAASAPARRQKPHHSEMEKKRAEDADAWRKAKKDVGKLTMPVEFHLSTSDRGAAYQQMLQEFLRQEEELKKEQATVRARPMPSHDRCFVVKPSAKPTTEPQPFELKSAALHAEAEVRLLQTEQLKVEARKSGSFKARPVPKALFDVKDCAMDRENHVPTVPLNVVLSSDLRAEKRKQFDASLATKATEQKRAEEERSRERAEEERRALQDLRRKSIQEGGTAFKAQPVMRRDPLAAKQPPTQKAVTMPQSPKLRLKERRAQSLAGTEAAKPAKVVVPLRRMTSAMPR